METGRTFYVDAAKSIVSKENKRYWKCSLVENGKNITNFANSKAKSALEAEAYGILATVYWLIEQKCRNKVILYSDAKYLVDARHFKRVSKQVEKNQERLERIKWGWAKIQGISKFKARHFINLAKDLAVKNKIKLELKWVPGVDNPADYFSRH